MDAEEAADRLRALGLREDDVQALVAHFADAERRGKLAQGFSRVEWLESQTFDPEARPAQLVSEPGYELWDGGAGLGYLVLEAVVRAQLASPPEHARVVVAGGASRRARSATGRGC